MQEDIESLNPQQKEAVLYNNGPSLVIAGAGSGKTRVLTYKVAYLLDLGLPPENILALTFTNKAAAEMKQRIARMVGYNKSKGLAMGTFHSIFARILRSEAGYLSLTPSFTIYDTDDSKSLVKAVMKDMGIDTKQAEKQYTPSFVLSRISAAKNSVMFPKDYIVSDFALQDKRRDMPRVGEIYTEYMRRLRAANAVDFDDLLLLTYVLFRDNEEILQKYRERFQFILVDEYQDTNTLQYYIVRMLAAQHHRVCVVGDDAQSIYAFRGAKIGNILNFCNNFPEARTFKLERNYRSTKNIVSAAGSLIKKNRGQLPKNVYSEKEDGEKVKIIETRSDDEEARMIAGKIKDMGNRGASYDDFAILYRTNSQSRKLEDALRSLSVPYEIYGGTSFYQRKEVKDILAYLRLIANHADDEALRRIINVPARGIGNVTMTRIAESARNNNTSLFDTASAPDKYGLEVSPAAKTKLVAFTGMIGKYSGMTDNMNALEIARELVNELDLNLTDEKYGILTPDECSRLENISELLGSIGEFCESRQSEGEEASLTGFLSLAVLATDQDTKKEDEDKPKVALMTIHAAKGLEFPNVFVAGMEDGLFPGPMSLADNESIEEERRLLYVAMTRAGNLCVLSYADERFLYGQLRMNKPSRFLDDISDKYVERSVYGYSNSTFVDFSRRDEGFFTRVRSKDFSGNGQQPRKTGMPVFEPRPEPRNLQRISPASSILSDEGLQSVPYGRGELHLGDIVVHDSFGEGQVRFLGKTVDGYTAKILFANGKERMMLLKFAKFSSINRG
ncbi:MAG: UvrD-helicase domain-containing protein [Bacteroidetes bacterium]|uniref:DNA 3'-5' helicase n=1 Tax=Candidatus Enterocola intestinipullorum TaxID=2840783 RepID=A0A9D9EHP4_9BACT|nr:UvrD-helicase domain-containing protein [Candidatus Enterocola intestinipullorum]